MSNDDQKHYGFNEGMPTGPDVTTILKKYPDLKIGDKMPRADLAEELHLEQTTERGRQRLITVMNALATRLLRDKNYVVKYVTDDKSWHVFTPSETWEYSSRQIESSRRKNRRVRNALQASASEANDELRERMYFRIRQMQINDREMKKIQMNILPPTQVKGSPKIEPPKQQQSNGK